MGEKWEVAKIDLAQRFLDRCKTSPPAGPALSLKDASRLVTHMIDDPYNMMGDQGDNMHTRIPLVYKEHGLLSLEIFGEWLKETCYMALKKEEMGIAPSPIASLDLQALKEGKYRLDPMRKGTEFLKRRFILVEYGGERRVVPFREVKDYHVRVGRSTQDQDDPRMNIARCIGLMWDTMGTNPEAAAFLQRAIDNAVAQAIVRGIHETEEAVWAGIGDFMLNDEFVLGRAFRWGMAPEELLGALGLKGVSIEHIREKFLKRDSEYEHRYSFRSDRAPSYEGIAFSGPAWIPPDRTFY